NDLAIGQLSTGAGLGAGHTSDAGSPGTARSCGGGGLRTVEIEEFSGEPIDRLSIGLRSDEQREDRRWNEKDLFHDRSLPQPSSYVGWGEETKVVGGSMWALRLHRSSQRDGTRKWPCALRPGLGGALGILGSIDNLESPCPAGLT